MILCPNILGMPIFTTEMAYHIGISSRPLAFSSSFA